MSYVTAGQTKAVDWMRNMPEYVKAYDIAGKLVYHGSMAFQLAVTGVVVTIFQMLTESQIFAYKTDYPILGQISPSQLCLAGAFGVVNMISYSKADFLANALIFGRLAIVNALSTQSFPSGEKPCTSDLQD